jgi:hypothetical protein
MLTRWKAQRRLVAGDAGEKGGKEVMATMSFSLGGRKDG